MPDLRDNENDSACPTCGNGQEPPRDDITDAAPTGASFLSLEPEERATLCYFIDSLRSDGIRLELHLRLMDSFNGNEYEVEEWTARLLAAIEAIVDVCDIGDDLKIHVESVVDAVYALEFVASVAALGSCQVDIEDVPDEVLVDKVVAAHKRHVAFVNGLPDAEDSEEVTSR